MRVLVDGQTILDEWRQQAPTSFIATASLTEGSHTIVVEYFDAGAGAIARLNYAKTAELPAPPPYTAEYFDNKALIGLPVLTRAENVIDYDWGDGSPDAAVPVDGFSARWTKTDTYAAGEYHLHATSDDGIRLFIDGSMVIDGWGDHPPNTYMATVTLTAGSHTVVVEYYENGGGAVARASLVRL
jgi:hypothetical protein